MMHLAKDGELSCDDPLVHIALELSELRLLADSSVIFNTFFIVLVNNLETTCLSAMEENAPMVDCTDAS